MYIAVDPGTTSGLVVARDVKSPTDFTLSYVAEISWSNRFMFLDLIRDNYQSVETIIIEDFRLYKSKAKDQINSQFPSVSVKAVIETAAYQYNIFDRIHYQMAYCIHRTVNGRMQSTVKLLDQHVDQLAKRNHAKDAYRHLRYYLITQGAKR